MSDNGDERDGGEVVDCEAVVARRDAPPIFEPAEHALDDVRLRDELLNGEIFYTLAEATVVIEGWSRHYNAVRPHSALGYRPPAPEVALWPLRNPDQLRRPPQPSRQRPS